MVSLPRKQSLRPAEAFGKPIVLAIFKSIDLFSCSASPEADN
jgi:hypothetical protein